MLRRTILATVVAVALNASASAAPVLDWSIYCESSRIAADGTGGVYTGHGGEDFDTISRYDSLGNQIWERQYFGMGYDGLSSMSADGLGDVYLGLQMGMATNAGVIKYDDAGNWLWTRQLGDMLNSPAVSADGLGSVYFGGGIGGPPVGGRGLLNKYDADGALQWTREFSLGLGDAFSSLSANGLGGVYASGSTKATLDDWDALLVKYDAEGNVLWVRQFGTSVSESAWYSSSDEHGGVYVAGSTMGSLWAVNSGGRDAFLGRYDSDGNLVWGRQVGTEGSDSIWDISADALGNVYFSGIVNSAGGAPNADGIISKYDANGNLLWTEMLGSGNFVNYISADGIGGFFVLGYDYNVGAGYLARFSDTASVPEPLSLIFFGTGLAGILGFAMKRKRRRV
jgi:hypothetical protein